MATLALNFWERIYDLKKFYKLIITVGNHFEHFIMLNGEKLQLFMFISVFFITWNIENFAGVVFNYKKWKHAFVNAPFILSNIPGQLLLGVAFAKTIEWTSLHQPINN